MSKSISADLKKRFLKINRMARQVIKDFSMKDIHLFRTEVRKLKSFLRLIGSSDHEDQHPGLPKKLHKFHDEIGLIRTRQLLKEKILLYAVKTKQAPVPKAYFEAIGHKLHGSIDFAKDLVKTGSVFEKEEKKLIRKTTDKLTPGQIRKFTWAEVNELRGHIGSLSKSDEEIHSARKVLKGLLNNWRYVKGEASAILPSTLYCSKADLRFIVKRLGKFSAAAARLELLHEDRAVLGTDEKELLFLKSLEKKWQQDRDALRVEIQELIQSRIPARHTFALLTDGNHAEKRDRLLAR